MDYMQDEPLLNYVTMRLGGPAKFLVKIHTEQELLQAVDFANLNSLKLLVIGKGSNIVFSDQGFDGLVIINQIDFIDIDTTSGTVTAGAGHDWDDFVAKTIDANLVGVEALSLIPGTVGAAPINNIGAYGQEVKQTIALVRAFDTKANSFVELTNQDCHFSYRNSLFKSEEYGRYLITRVVFRLDSLNGNYVPPKYASVQSVLTERQITQPTPQIIRDLVIDIRSDKLPDPAVIPNSGSFFKNPIVSYDKRNDLLLDYPDLVYFDYKGQAKLAAGWLIDKAGLKGYEQDGIKVYDKQALVLVNQGTRSYESLNRMIKHIESTVYQKFGVSLEPEPELK